VILIKKQWRRSAFSLTVLFLFSVCSYAGDPLIIADRGAPDYAPENTVLSFTMAESQGAAAMKMDLWLTADNKLAVGSDQTTGRIWSRNLDMESSTMEQLASLTLNYGFRAAFRGATAERLPEFCEVLEKLSPETEVLAELKTQNRQAAEVLAAEIQRMGSENHVTMISCSKEVVESLCKKNLQAVWRVDCDSPEQVLALLVPDGAGLMLDSVVLDKSTVEALHEKGIAVYSDTENDQREAERMKECETDGILCRCMRPEK